MVSGKHTIVKSSQHTTACFGCAADDTTSPSEQAAAGSCTESTGKRLHRTAVSQRQLHQFLSATSCACTDNPEGCIRAHGSVNSQVFSADRQAWNWKLWICGSSLSTLVTLRRNTLFLSSSLNAQPFTPPTHWHQTRSSAGSSLCWKIHHLRWMPWACLTSLILLLLYCVIFPQGIKNAFTGLLYFFYIYYKILLAVLKSFQRNIFTCTTSNVLALALHHLLFK